MNDRNCGAMPPLHGWPKKSVKLKEYYCVFDEGGNPLLNTIKYYRRDSIEAATLLPAWSWSLMRKRGWTIEKVHVQITRTNEKL